MSYLLKSTIVPAREKPEFNKYAARYEQEHRESIGFAGEDPIYYAQYKATMLRRFISLVNLQGPILDFGCAIGNLTSRWREIAYFVPRRVLRSKATKDLSRDIRMLCERSFLTAFVRTRRWRETASRLGAAV